MRFVSRSVGTVLYCSVTHLKGLEVTDSKLDWLSGCMENERSAEKSVVNEI